MSREFLYQTNMIILDISLERNYCSLLRRRGLNQTKVDHLSSVWNGNGKNFDKNIRISNVAQFSHAEYGTYSHWLIAVRRFTPFYTDRDIALLLRNG
jgi:hypothetical protein